MALGKVEAEQLFAMKMAVSVFPQEGQDKVAYGVKKIKEICAEESDKLIVSAALAIATLEILGDFSDG